MYVNGWMLTTILIFYTTFWEGTQNTNMIQYYLQFISVYEYVASKIMYYKILLEKTGVRANLFSYLAKSINLAPNF